MVYGQVLFTSLDPYKSEKQQAPTRVECAAETASYIRCFFLSAHGARVLDGADVVRVRWGDSGGVGGGVCGLAV